MVAATLTLMALTLTGQVVTLHSDKPFVTAEESARIELRALDDSGRPLAGAQVSLTVNLGSVTEPVPAQDGTFSATFRSPSQEGPGVALLHALVKKGSSSASAWLSLPVHGSHRLTVKAPPRSRVRVSVGAATFGPVTASASGEATLPVTVPPGVTSAQVTTVDRAGRSRTQTVPLPAPRFARIRLVALEPAIEARPVRLQGFVVDESGNPAVSVPPLSVTVERGTLGPIEPKEGGTFELPYTAAAPNGAPVTLAAAPTEDADADRAFTLQLEPRPAPSTSPGATGPDGRTPVSSAGPLTPHAGSGWQPSVGVFLFGQTNAAASNGLGLRMEASLQLAELPWEALLQLEGRQNLKESELLSSGQGSSGVTRSFTLRGLGARLGARWSHPVLTRGLLFADASVGFLRMSGALHLVREGESFMEPISSKGPAFSVGGGLGWAVGPGRACGQLQWAYAPGRGKVSGNLGGLSLGVGYQLAFGGGPRP